MNYDNAPFDESEYDDRLTRVRKSMAAAGLDAIFVTDPSNQAWLTGYDGLSF
ncbi:MAG: ectoine hydrolase DoeA, partial [Symploca sp. SIO3E6]|nr:ectoine hydrolase DoeA [Caldora sp. SIO3E6]